MNYIYDIVLNFQDKYYQFFEWNKNDKIKNISKIPIYRVTDQDILSLKYNQVKLDQNFINNLKEDNKKKKLLMCLVSNTTVSIGILLSQDGTLLKRSSLIFDEEDEVNDFSNTLPVTHINYVKNIKVVPEEKLRIEIEKKDFIVSYITMTEDIVTLKYLYYEYFEEECDQIDKIKKTLLKEFEKTWNKKQNSLYNIINLLNQKNQPIK